jgi:hypothetical protein
VLLLPFWEPHASLRTHWVDSGSAADYAYVEINRELRRKHADLIASILDQLLRLGAAVSVNEDNDLLTINAEYKASLILARCRITHAGSHRWQLRFDESLSPDIVIAARLQPGNAEIMDYYLLPRLDILMDRLRLRPENGLVLIPIAQIHLANPSPAVADDGR